MTTKNPVQRFDMDAEDIDRLMSAFYARIRAHDTLGPIFIRAVGAPGDPHWKDHEAKIASFWRNAILMDREYRGSPMQAHFLNGEVKPEHFEPWLDLFHMTARDVLSPDKAASICALADRIGKGLRWGLESATENRLGEVPNLR